MNIEYLFIRIEETAFGGAKTTEGKAIIIHSLRGLFRLKDILAVTEFLKSTYMYWQNRFERENHDEALEKEMFEIRKERKDYGYRRIWGELKNRGIFVNKKKLQRIVQKLNLVDLLYKDYYLDDNRYDLIDVVLVILDGSGRNMGTTYRLLNEVVAPIFQIERILVTINQADMAMQGRHWDEQLNCSDSVLHDFLEGKADYVRSRLAEATGARVSKAVCYSAEGGYNIEKLLDMVIDNMPRERRNLVV